MITIQASPAINTPGYNPMNFLLSSDNTNNLGFRYIVEVFLAGTATKLFEKKVPPRPIDGYGVCNISREIQSYLSMNVPFGQDNLNATNHSVNFDIKFGEEYRVPYTFTGYVFGSGALTGFQLSASHPFIVGDIIDTRLNTLPNDFRDALQGVFAVMALAATNIVITNLPYIGDGSDLAGSMFYADGRKSRFLNVVALTNLLAYNGTMDIVDFKNTNQGTFLILASNRRVLSSRPTISTQTLSQFEWVGYLNRKATVAKKIVFKNSLGTAGSKTIQVGTTLDVGLVGVGLGNIGTLTYTIGSNILEAGATWITWQLFTAADAAISIIYTTNIDRRCEIEPIQLLFLDRLGTWGSFAFQLRANETETNKKLSYNKVLPVPFETYDGGEIIHHASVGTDFTLRTNWMGVAMAAYYSELVSSGFVYMKIGDDWISVSVSETTNEIERSANKHQIRKTLTVRTSTEITVNV